MTHKNKITPATSLLFCNRPTYGCEAAATRFLF